MPEINLIGTRVGPPEYNIRARLFYRIGGRTHTFALSQKDVALSPDMHGNIYLNLDDDDDDQWCVRLAKEFIVAGLEIDMNIAL
jgi:hypothetical protein